MKRFLCWLLGHKSEYYLAKDKIYNCRCKRCKVDPPVKDDLFGW